MDEEAQLADRLARIEEQLKELIRLSRTRGEDHEQRLRALERWRYALPVAGLSAVISAIAAIFVR